MENFIFSQLKSTQGYCSTFSSCFNAGFSSFFSTNKFVKKLFFYGTLLLLVFSQESLYSQSTKPSANLDQIRNGAWDSPIDPANWVNGNAGASQAHYAEGWSVAYRILLGNLATGVNVPHELIIEWDVRHSGKNALDFITGYNNIDHPTLTHSTTFGHNPEQILPLQGLAGPFSAPVDYAILAPPTNPPLTYFNAVPAAKRMITIYNGAITGMEYIGTPDLTAAKSAQRFKITFTASDPRVLIAWGGHIAAEYDWGTGNGATAVSGSPYHMRLISIDGTGGNQDRSLAAAAVAAPPPSCDISPAEQTICAGGTAQFSGPAGLSGYSWSITGSTATLTNADQQTVTVNGATTGGSPYTLTLVTTNSGGTDSVDNCTATLTVNETAAPSVTYNPPACDENTFSITITGVISGAIYTVKDINGGNIMNISPDSPYTALNTDNITFSNIPTGSGYQVTASVSDCPSTATSCGTASVQSRTKTAEVITPIETKSENVTFTAYPVPFKENINIRYNFNYKTNARIEIYDLRGRLLMTHDDPDAYFDKEVTLETKFNHSEMQIFFVKVTTDKGSTTKKIISTK